MNASSDWPRNRLLLALPSRNLKRLMLELEHIRCQREQILIDADSSLDHVFFPDSGVVSVVAVYADGSIIEMATIREGVVTSLKEEHENSASRIFSNDRDCLAPHVHSRRAKGSVRPCRSEMTLDVESVVGGCVS